MTDATLTKKDGLLPSQDPNQLTGAPKARIVGFPTRLQGTGKEASPLVT
jgi:hypothetical protein